MTTIEGNPDPLRFLREAVVALAAARFEKYYHHPTAIHIVKQLDGTHFRGTGISGTGDFADVAYQGYVAALRAYVEREPERRLREYETRLSSYAPVGVQRVEVQVPLPGEFAAEMKERAKGMKQGVASYIDALLERCLPLGSDEVQLATFMSRYVQDPTVDVVRRRTYHLSVPFTDFERLERIADLLPANCPRTVGDVVSNMILAQRVLSRGEQNAH